MGFENGYPPPPTLLATSPLTPPSVALVTGAGSGLARGIVLELVREGCRRVVAVDIIPERLAETAQLAREIDPAVDVLNMTADVADATAVQAMVAAAVRQFGRIDYAVHCAGISGTAARTDELAVGDFDAVMAVNIRGMWLCQKAVLAQMKAQPARTLP